MRKATGHTGRKWQSNVDGELTISRPETPSELLMTLVIVMLTYKLLYEKEERVFPTFKIRL